MLYLIISLFRLRRSAEIDAAIMPEAGILANATFFDVCNWANQLDPVTSPFLQADPTVCPKPWHKSSPSIALSSIAAIKYHNPSQKSGFSRRGTSMWECSNCHEKHEDSFDVCWNCGTSRDGAEDPTFERAEDYQPPHLDAQLASRFVCTKCKNSGASVKRFAATGTGLSKLFDIQHNTFIAVSCSRCGYTEVFNPEILEGKETLGSILDLIFGG